jgi:hypothetical protein
MPTKVISKHNAELVKTVDFLGEVRRVDFEEDYEYFENLDVTVMRAYCQVLAYGVGDTTAILEEIERANQIVGPLPELDADEVDAGIEEACRIFAALEAGELEVVS